MPGAQGPGIEQHEADGKSKNAKRREAARRKKDLQGRQAVDEVGGALGDMQLQAAQQMEETKTSSEIDPDAERQKSIRNQLKKLRAVRELKARKATGEKLSADQLVKIAKEQEIVRDLAKLSYQGPELGDAPEP